MFKITAIRPLHTEKIAILTHQQEIALSYSNIKGFKSSFSSKRPSKMLPPYRNVSFSANYQRTLGLLIYQNTIFSEDRMAHLV